MWYSLLVSISNIASMSAPALSVCLFLFYLKLYFVRQVRCQRVVWSVLGSHCNATQKSTIFFASPQIHDVKLLSSLLHYDTSVWRSGKLIPPLSRVLWLVASEKNFSDPQFISRSLFPVHPVWFLTQWGYRSHTLGTSGTNSWMCICRYQESSHIGMWWSYPGVP